MSETQTEAAPVEEAVAETPAYAPTEPVAVVAAPPVEAAADPDPALVAPDYGQRERDVIDHIKAWTRREMRLAAAGQTEEQRAASNP